MVIFKNEKVTPAHDFNDFSCSQRHNLPIINIFNDDGTLNENAGIYKVKRFIFFYKKNIRD